MKAKRTTAPVAAPSGPSRLVRDITNEAWIAKRLALPDLFLGVTTLEVRRDRLKVVLIQRELVDSIAGRAEGKPITWRDLFKQLYDAELTN